MRERIKLYKIYPSPLTGGNFGYSLTEPADSETLYDPVVCVLPEGYELAKNTNDMLMIFDPEGEGAEIIGNKQDKHIMLLTTQHKETAPIRPLS